MTYRRQYRRHNYPIFSPLPLKTLSIQFRYLIDDIPGIAGTPLAPRQLG